MAEHVLMMWHGCSYRLVAHLCTLPGGRHEEALGDHHDRLLINIHELSNNCNQQTLSWQRMNTTLADVNLHASMAMLMLHLLHAGCPCPVSLSH